MPACCSWNDVFQYETNKVTRIQSVNYGTIKWILHMTVFSYVSFALMSDKLYQRKEPLISSVHTKVKGVAEVTENVTEGGVTKLVHGIFDTADYTLPLQGNSFFVMTNYLKSEGQEQKLCPEALCAAHNTIPGMCVIYFPFHWSLTLLGEQLLGPNLYQRILKT